MENERSSNNNRNLLIVLVCLVFVIIVLVAVGAVVMINRSNSDNLGSDTFSTTDSAAEIIDKISMKANDDPNYGLSQASKDYEIAMNTTDSNEKLGIAMSYANYVGNDLGDTAKAIEILKSVESLAVNNDDDNVKLNYYVTLRGIYQRAGDTGQYDYYNQKIIEILPEPTNKNNGSVGE